MAPTARPYIFASDEPHEALGVRRPVSKTGNHLVNILSAFHNMRADCTRTIQSRDRSGLWITEARRPTSLKNHPPEVELIKGSAWRRKLEPWRLWALRSTKGAPFLRVGMARRVSGSTKATGVSIDLRSGENRKGARQCRMLALTASVVHFRRAYVQPLQCPQGTNIKYDMKGVR